MSMKPYSPNFPESQGYAPPPEDSKLAETYPMISTPATYPGYPSAPPGHPAQPPAPMGHSPTQYGFQAGFHPVVQPGYPQPAYNPGPVVQQPAPMGHAGPMPMGHAGPMPMGQPGGWMSIPQGLSNCPPGLEYLSMIDKLMIKQKVELLESFIRYETNNKYTVVNSAGQKVYYAVEDNDCCTRNCCGPSRPFDMKIFDNFHNEVIHLSRPLACDSCLCPCWLQSVEVTAPPGRVIGTVEQTWSICKPCYVIKNAAGQVVLQIKGPVCTFSCCGDVKFNVYSKDGETKVGKIVKQWSGLAREVFTDADYFGISFPMDLDVRVKATLLGACFLIDFMFFEKGGNQQ